MTEDFRKFFRNFLFEHCLAEDTKAIGVCNVLSSKIEARHSEDEITDWCVNVEEIFSLDKNFPTEHIPAQSYHVEKVLKSLKDNIMIEEEAKKEGAKVLGLLLADSSESVTFGAIEYLHHR